MEDITKVARQAEKDRTFFREETSPENNLRINPKTNIIKLSQWLFPKPKIPK
jgi:hypothetical protein